MTETVYTDEDGTLFKYLVSYSYNREEQVFTIWAESRVDAEDRLQAIGESGMVMARVIKEIPLKQGGEIDG